MIIDGKAIAARVREEVAASAAAIDPKPALAVLLVGGDEASHIYVRGKERAAAAAGIRSVVRREETLTQDEARAIVEGWANDDTIDAILVQLPLPEAIDEREVLDAIPVEKDADGLSPASLGRLLRGDALAVPCTPQGCMRLIAEAGVDPQGKDALVVGRSLLVGKPMAALLTAAHATVTLAHSRTQDLEERVGRAEILVAAVGKPGCIPGAWVREGAVVLDVGITRGADGLVGDVGFDEAAHRAAAITPVPGGVGPMTIAYLLANTVALAARRRPGA